MAYGVAFASVVTTLLIFYLTLHLKPFQQKDTFMKHLPNTTLIAEGFLTIGGAGFPFGPGSSAAIGYGGTTAIRRGEGSIHLHFDVKPTAVNSAFIASGIILTPIWQYDVPTDTYFLQLNCFNPQVVPVVLVEPLRCEFYAIKFDAAVGETFAGEA